MWLATPAGALPTDAAARLAAVHLIDPGTTVLLAVHAPHAVAVRAHAARAADAAAAVRTGALAAARAADVAAAVRTGALAAARSVEGAVQRAAALWDRQLFFEVHEVLEEVWQRTTGLERQALQAVIQVAVAFHHLAHGNVRGARKLLAEGRERLAAVPTALPVLDAPGLLAATSYWADALAVGSTPTDAPPRLPLVA